MTKRTHCFTIDNPTIIEHFVCVWFANDDYNLEEIDGVADIAAKYNPTEYGDPKNGIVFRSDKNDDLGDYAFSFEDFSKAQKFSEEVSSLECVIKVELGKLTTISQLRIEKNYEAATIKNG